MPTAPHRIPLTHPAGPPPDDIPRKFYVTALDDTQTRYVFLLGPFDAHAEALAHVTLGSQLMYVTYPTQAPWLAYGTAGVAADAQPPRTLFSLSAMPAHCARQPHHAQET